MTGPSQIPNPPFLVIHGKLSACMRVPASSCSLYACSHSCNASCCPARHTGRRAPAPLEGPVHRRLLPTVFPHTCTVASTINHSHAHSRAAASRKCTHGLIISHTVHRHSKYMRQIPLTLRKKLLAVAKTTVSSCTASSHTVPSHRSSPPKSLLSKSSGAHSAPAGATSSKSPKPAEAAVEYTAREWPARSGCDSLTS